MALAEDGATDVTTAVTVPAGLQAEGGIEFRSGGVLAGAAFADAVARALRLPHRMARIRTARLSRRALSSASSTGPLARILRAERPMLNLLQRACGIATRHPAPTSDAVAGTSCRILHTRKTAPGLRALDIAAVIAGGGTRHRADLSARGDGQGQSLAGAARRAAATLADALDRARARGIAALQVEVESSEQVEEACAAGATRLLVDNQTPETVRRWAERARGLRPGSRSRRPAASRWRTSGPTPRPERISSRSGR